jgi:hypothetical protein
LAISHTAFSKLPWTRWSAVEIAELADFSGFPLALPISHIRSISKGKSDPVYCEPSPFFPTTFLCFLSAAMNLTMALAEYCSTDGEAPGQGWRMTLEIKSTKDDVIRGIG